MLHESYYDRIRVILRCAGCEPCSLAPWRCGFDILKEPESSHIVRHVEKRFQKPMGQAIVVMPVSFGNTDGEAQESAIREGEKYQKALQENGLEAEVLIQSRGPENISDFAVYVYIPLSQAWQRAQALPAKAQVQFRVTMYGQGDAPVKHDVMIELTLKPDSPWGYRIDEPAPAHLNGSDVIIRGKGQTKSIAITDWLRSLVSHLDYVPEYRKREGNG